MSACVILACEVSGGGVTWDACIYVHQNFALCGKKMN
jgi:hypothetical protein